MTRGLTSCESHEGFGLKSRPRHTAVHRDHFHSFYFQGISSRSWHSVCTNWNQLPQKGNELTDLGDLAGGQHELHTVSCLRRTKDRLESVTLDERFAKTSRQNYINTDRCQLCDPRKNRQTSAITRVSSLPKPNLSFRMNEVSAWMRPCYWPALPVY